MTQRLKVVPSSVAYDIAGDYFQALRHIIAPAAPMVRQQSSLISTRNEKYCSEAISAEKIATFHFPVVLRQTM